MQTIYAGHMFIKPMECSATAQIIIPYRFPVYILYTGKQKGIIKWVVQKEIYLMFCEVIPY